MAMSQQPTPPVNKHTGSYTEDADGDGIRMNAFDNEDADVAFDPLSANRRFPGMDLALARRSGHELRNAYIVTKSPELNSSEPPSTSCRCCSTHH